MTAAGVFIATALSAAAQQPATVAVARTPGERVLAKATEPARAALRTLIGNRASALTTIQGNALDALNHTLPHRMVRLRDARSGRIVDQQLTDEAGVFSFQSVEPGSYIVELVDSDDSILAASQLINVNAGDTASAIVKLPFRIPPFGGVLGHGVATAVAIVLAAGSAAVLGTVATRSVSSPE